MPKFAVISFAAFLIVGFCNGKEEEGNDLDTLQETRKLPPMVSLSKLLSVVHTTNHCLHIQYIYLN